MIDYNAKTDAELSILVCTETNQDFEILNKKGYDEPFVKISDWASVVFDINNPSDMMPIVFEHRICIKPHPFSSTAWNAIYTDENKAIHATKENPLRAAAICFLKMKDAENELH